MDAIRLEQTRCLNWYTVDSPEHFEEIASSDSFVTWAFRAVDEAERRGRGFASLGGASVMLAVAEGARVPWNCSRMAMVVARTVDSSFDILSGVGVPLLVDWGVVDAGRNFDATRRGSLGFCGAIDAQCCMVGIEYFVLWI